MKILVVVDMQNDFINGALGTPDAQAIVPNVKKKIEEAAKNGDLIVYTKDTHYQDYLDTKEGKKLPVEHCLIDSEGWQIPDELLPPVGYTNVETINKPTFGSFALAEMLARIDCDEIELCGLCTDICVVSNALILKARLYNDVEISVDANCCAGVTHESHVAALKTMEMCQINVYC